MMSNLTRTLFFAWYVMTYSGQPVAGPFTLLSACTEVAQLMASQDATISPVCWSR